MLLVQFMIVIPARGLVAKVEIASSSPCFLAKARTGTSRNDIKPNFFVIVRPAKRAVAIPMLHSIVWQQTPKQESSLVFPAKGGPPTYRTTYFTIDMTKILTNSHPTLQQKKEAGQKPASLPTKKFIGFGVCLSTTTQQ